MTKEKEEYPVLWTPTEKQAEFLSADEDEVLYGGAVAGGKTDALVIDSLGLTQQAILNPKYRALIIRRTYPELTDIIDRSKSIYPLIAGLSDSVYNEAKHEWRFPSGAKLIFGHGISVQDATKYQGQEFQYIGFEELTQWPSHEFYEFLKSRLRGTELKKYIRATANPGGAGSKWVQNYFKIPDDGSETNFSVDYELPSGKVVTSTRRFIPARLSDNPHIPEEYLKNIMSMDEQDKKALIFGRWDVQKIKGAVYQDQIDDIVSKGRNCEFSYEESSPVYVACDLGMSDSFTMVFFQKCVNEYRILDYYENNGNPISHYCQIIKDKPYPITSVILPHDARVRELGTGKSREDVFREYGFKTIICPKLSVADGINFTRSELMRTWIRRNDTTQRLMDVLKYYRYKWNDALQVFSDCPIHDQYSHGADCLRYMFTGYRDITKDMVKLNTKPKLNIGLALSGSGWMAG